MIFLLIQFVETIWLNHLAMHLCLQIFSSIKQFSREVLPNLVEKMKQQFIFVKLILIVLIYECLREHIMCLPL